MSIELLEVALDQHDDRVVAELVLEVLGRAVGARVVVDELIGPGVRLQAQRGDRGDEREGHDPRQHRNRPLDAPARDPCEAIPHNEGMLRSAQHGRAGWR